MIIWIEEQNNTIAAFEYKQEKAKAKTPTEFAKSYVDAKFEIINQDNYLDFILYKKTPFLPFSKWNLPYSKWFWFAMTVLIVL